MKVRKVLNVDNQTVIGYSFYCPGCKHDHVYYTASFADQYVWSFNGDQNTPTFTPSLLNTWTKPPSQQEIKRCHLFVTDGKIQFCGDCTHSLSGQTIEMVDVE